MPKQKTDNWFRVTKVELDSNGELPTRIMLMQSGSWPTSIKGNLEIKPEDIQQVKDNFDKGIGFPTADASTGLAIDFKHEYADEAAAWIRGLEVDNSDPKITRLFANPVEWTDNGAAAVRGGQFKCISPAGYFGRSNDKLQKWPNPQNLKEKIANVLDGAGLTNIPFLRGMSPIRASAQEDLDDKLEYDKVIFISDKQTNNQEPKMKLDAIRVKEAEKLTAEEKEFLLEPEQATQLDADELKKFGIKLSFAADEDDDKDPKNQLSAEDKELLTDENKALLAAIKSGDKKVIATADQTADQQRLSALEQTAEQYRTEKATSVVELHVKRGAIKQDSSDFWTKQLLSAETDEDRKALEDQLTGLPGNELLAKEIGTGEDVSAGATAREQYDALAKAKVAAAAKEGKELLYADALKQVSRENPDLATQDTKQQLSGGAN